MDSRQMTSIKSEIQRLRDLASKATPGPWKNDELYISANGYEGGSPSKRFHVAQIRGWGHLQYLGEDKAINIQDVNGEFIAAANPLTIQRLCDALDIMEQALEMFASGELGHCCSSRCDGETDADEARDALTRARQMMAGGE